MRNFFFYIRPMKKIFLLPTLLLLILGAQAADKSKKKKNAPVLEKALQTNNSLFWQISGNGLEQPSYLYGTIHAIPQDDYFLGKKVSEKIKKAGTIVMEIDMKDMDIVALAQLSVLENEKTIKDYMSDSDYTILTQFMADTIGIPAKTFERTYGRLKPFYLEQLIFFNYLGQNKESYERNFKDMAEDHNLPVVGLETYEQQLKMLEDIPMEDQLKSMVKTIKNYTQETQKMDQMVRYYTAQNTTALAAIFEEEENAYVKDNLLDKRNKAWISRLSQLMQEKNCFIAVGAGHLGGKNGLVQLLRDAGYTVDAVSTDK